MFICCSESCGQRFVKYKDFKLHKKLHKGKKNHNCNICNRCFNEYDLSKHKKHFHKIIWRCQRKDCGLEFEKIEEYQEHQNMHKQNDLTKIKCSSCGMQFQEQKSLVSHQEKIHAGPKVIKCEICFKELTFLEGIPHWKEHAEEETHGYMCLIDDCGKIKYN